MKKVGVLTFSEANNYGAMLQTYALQAYVNSLGYDCSVIRYRNKTIWKAYHYASVKERPSFFSYIKKNLELFAFRNRRKKFEAFRDKCNLTKVVYGSDLQTMAKEYDRIIVGSDQVWNPHNTEGDRHFLLDFVDDDSKKVAYAASFGNTSLFSEFGVDSEKLLAKIPHVSVREKQGQEYLRSQFNIDSECVCDPVLLLSRDEWKKQCVQCVDPEEQYIFVYLLKPNQELINSVNELAAKEGMKVFVIPGVINAASQAKRIKRSKVILDAGPGEMLSLIDGAKYMITDSFHGTALSIILQKQFVVFADQKAGNTNSRIESILSVCGLKDRIVHTSAEVTDSVKKTIDYRVVMEKLDQYKAASMEFLRESLS